ncbi:Serine/threonine-protein kinase PknA [Rubripirellula lacrimiformis]|uniref:Serine/threonine-protein kinase PknA n=1 Tax=Rubripirellula lacrimiformis TaxID=1930273 RepID=A0A517N3T2_9BACT|nr:serine/threonine-protein kinase [Rubripirellula lacrimiformis]QDT01801.1 Serine/threonine-protein kinase PknA [Rubripirellula lacrimiformis]
MPRSRLGPLAIESKLGDHPSQSCVWRAVHVQLKKAVAVKVFSAPFGGTPEARAIFASEWQRLKKLQHPALAKCFGGGFEETDAYLAYELLEGETLAAQLERRGRLSWESVLDMAEPLASALEYLHTKDIVYGRLEPDKIMFAGLSPVLIDIRIERNSSPFRTNRPPKAAELALRAPELATDPNAVSPATDLYALGATLYLALTGRPPAAGDTIETVTQSVIDQMPPSPASLVMECPVWLDKLVMQLLQKQPGSRPPNAGAVILALGEVRRRSMSRSGVAEHASSGFSPLAVTDQRDRDVARELLGREAIDLDDDKVPDGTPWHDRPLVLIAGLFIVAGLFAYLLWPLNEDQMRQKADDLLTQQSRSAMNQAKQAYLVPMLEKYPEGVHANWAKEQIDRVDMYQAEHALEVKLKRNLPLQNEGERLYAEASQYERFGDAATALDQYRSMQTLLGDDPQYRPFVNLARRRIARIEIEGVNADEASRMIDSKLSEADELFASGKVVAARKIWYSIVELYDNNDNVAPLVEKAQSRLSGNANPSGTE